MIETITIIGAFLGIIAFIWTVWDALASYLHIYLDKPILEHNRITVRARIINTSRLDKKIDYAFLLVGPETESPIETARTFASKLGLKESIDYTNDIQSIRTNYPVYSDQGHAFIPLPFFYSEQVAIGDEDLSYRCSLEASKFDPGIPYSIRFYIFSSFRLHRVTQENFIISARDHKQLLNNIDN